VLIQLHNALQADTRVALSHPLGISGLGGIGKTQAALEYAYRYRSEYNAVFWVRADSLTALISSLIELASVLELPERDAQDQEIIVEAVLHWLRLHPGWLLIYDNIDDLSIAEPLLPREGAGHLVFTTRAQAFGFAQRLNIQKMEPEIGALLLLRRADRIAIEARLNMAKPDEQSIARAISQELDGLPLALDQAGAYIKEAPCSLPDYLTRYHTHRSNILRVRGSSDQDYPASVATTWSLSFDKVRQTNPVSVELLEFCAFTAPDAIPEEMIMAGASYLGPLLQPVISHPMLFDQSIATLLAYSLVTRNADNNVLGIHRLVQAILQDTLEEAQRRTWAERVTLAVNAAFPHAEYGTWSQCERLLPHASLSARYIKEDRIMSEQTGRLLYETAFYLHNRARYTEAEPLYRQALHIQEQQLKPKHTDVASTLNGLALLYAELDKYAEAEPLYQRALRIREQESGPEHHDVVYPLNNLANLYYEQGKYAEAEPLYQRALHIQEQQLGLEHPDMTPLLGNLGELYREQGKYVEAESLFQRALHIREQQLGFEHPLVIGSLNGLAIIYAEQGKYMDAEPLFQRALRIGEQLMGPEHPDVAYPLSNLAELYLLQGKSSENSRAQRVRERKKEKKEERMQASA
jgi:tetratricopeptide (TPR) repeat protein